ncbi:hypothetical protein B0H14DRAFT_2626294 [Mycena olivaceomarginata]|nr:hypothetical protein B0H14DRAFT_2626294 [Mycena olivaceomarginata]
MKLQRELLPITQFAQQFKALYKVHMWGYGVQNQELAFRKEMMLSIITGTFAKKKCEQGTGVHLVDVPDSDNAVGVPKCDAQLHNFMKIVINATVWDANQGGERHLQSQDGVEQQVHQTERMRHKKIWPQEKLRHCFFDKFLGELAEGNRTGGMTGVMHFEFWSEDKMDLLLEEQGKVAVVQNTKGCLLVRVKDSDVWHTQVDVEATKAKKAAEKVRKKVTMASKTQDKLPPPHESP